MEAPLATCPTPRDARGDSQTSSEGVVSFCLTQSEDAILHRFFQASHIATTLRTHHDASIKAAKLSGRNGLVGYTHHDGSELGVDGKHGQQHRGEKG